MNMHIFVIDSSVLSNAAISSCTNSTNNVKDNSLNLKRKYTRNYTRHYTLKPDGSKKRSYCRAPKVNKRLDCDVCKTTFGTKYDLRKHQLKHIKDNPFIKINYDASTEKCTRNDTNTEEIKTNEANAEEFKRNEMTTEEFKTNEASTEEYKTNEANTEEFKTNEISTEEFKTNITSTEEFKTNETSSEEFKTNEASAKKFKANEFHTKHLCKDLKFHPESDIQKNFNCSNRTGENMEPDRSSLSNHSLKPFDCNLCKRALIQNYALPKRKKNHRVCRPLLCNICHCRFSHQTALNMHYHKHAKDKYVCTVCQKGFGLIHLLQKHKKAHMKYSCNICQKGFLCRSYLIEHYKIHISGKPFICDICKQSFILKSRLFSHYHSHTDVKPIICPVCQKVFRYRITFESHYRGHKLQYSVPQKPFICQLCKKEFNNRLILQFHYRIHTDEKPFACDFCSKAYAFRCNFIRHMHIHMKVKVLSCNLCKNSFKSKCEFQKHKCFLKTENVYDVDLNTDNLLTDVKSLSNKSLVNHIGNQMSETTLTSEEHKLNHINENVSQNEHISDVKKCDSGTNQILLSGGKTLHACNVSFMNDESDAYWYNRNVLEINTEIKECAYDIHVKKEVLENDNGKYEYLCEICQTTFMSKETLQSHSVLHVNDKLSFSTCQNKVKSISEVANCDCSVISEKGEKKKLEINADCEFNIPVKKEIFENPTDIHNSEFLCGICDTSFTDEKSLHLHYAIHKSNDEHIFAENHNKFKPLSQETNQHCIKQNEKNASEEQKLFDAVNLMCDICQASFLEEKHLLLHYAVHKKEMLFVCHLCSKTFTRKRNLKLHYLYHTLKQRYACNKCPKTFLLKSYLTKHKFTHVKRKSFACGPCNEAFKTKSELNKHLFFKHKTDYLSGMYNIKSVVEFLPFSEVKKLEQFFCNICKRGFKSKSDLKEHGAVHTATNGSQNECPVSINKVCQMALFDEENQLTYSVQHNKQVICNTCQKVFKTKEKLNEHIIFVHNEKSIPPKQPYIDKNEYICHICEEIFHNEKSLQLHTNKSFLCVICLEAFKSCYELKSHQDMHNHKIFENNKTEYECDICHAACNEKTYLNSHYDIHKNGKLFNCHLCSKNFMFKNTLKEHLISHSAKKIFPFEVCSKNHDNHLLRSLQESIDNKHYVCDTCKKSFKTEYEMHEHELQEHEVQYLSKQNKETFNSDKLLSPINNIRNQDEFTCSCTRQKLEASHALKNDNLNIDIKNKEVGTFVEYKNNKILFCGICQKQFNLFSELHEHKLTHIREKDLQNENLINIKNEYACAVCHTVFSDEESLILHCAVHSDLELFSCDACQKTFASNIHLEEHYQTMHIQNEVSASKTVVAEKESKKCEMELLSNINLESHVEVNNQLYSPEVSEKVKTTVLCNFTIGACDKESISESNSNHNKYVHICDICLASFMKHDDLESHYAIHKKSELYVCHICPGVFVLKHSLKWHLASHNSKKFFCDECPKFYLKEKSLTLHKSKVHANENQFCCSICFKGFKTRIELKKHKLHIHKNSLVRMSEKTLLSQEPSKEKRKNKYIYFCDVCKKEFTTISNLQSHLLIHAKRKDIQKETVTGLMCKVCHEIFFDEESVKSHYNTHSYDELFKIGIELKNQKQCVLIQENLHTETNTKRQESMSQIYKTTDKRTLQSSSKMSSIPFVYNKKLSKIRPKFEKSKTDIHSDENSDCYTKIKNCVCDICHGRFTTEDLLSHYAIHKTDETYTCNLCPETFMTKDFLKSHLVSHTNKKIFACAICSKLYATKPSLMRHLYSHTGEKRFTCDDCGKGFIERYLLKKHKSRVHKAQNMPRTKPNGLNSNIVSNDNELGDKDKIACNICKTEFKTCLELKNHEIVHKSQNEINQDMKDHICKICHVNFPDDESLVLHSNTHKNHEMFSCGVCGKTFKTHVQFTKHKISFHKRHEVLQNEIKNDKMEYQCKTCHLIFYDEKSLQSHSIVHSHKKSYTCNACLKSFKTCSALKSHERNKHKINKVS